MGALVLGRSRAPVGDLSPGQASGTWLFTNAEHDFPKRIGYTLQGDALNAWIDDGTEKGQRMDFVLKRVE